MFSIALIAGWICVAVWVYLLVGHGHFWRVSLLPALADRRPERGTQSIPDAAESEDPYARLGAASFSPAVSVEASRDSAIAAVIPARNEADVIGRAVTSLLQQTTNVLPTLSPESGEDHGAPSLHIFVVDDNSADGTAEVARKAALEHSASDRVTIISGRRLPPGWSGKLWALQQGVEQALTLKPDFLLFTDADIEYSSHNVGLLISVAENGRYDLVSFMVKLHCRSLAERLLIPAFVFFFFMLYPPEWIRDPGRKTAGAAGGCILIRPAALERIGGIAAIREEIIDDCALARAVKQSGGRVWLGATAGSHSVRPYDSFADVERMIARTAFNQLRHSALLLLGTVAGMLLIYVLPLALLFSGSARLSVLGAIALLLMCGSYLPMVRFYGLSPLWALTLPVSATFYTVATIHSAIKYWSGRGGEWKGRAQDR